MKNISLALTNFFLGNTTFGRADLITIALTNGTVLNVTYGTNVTTITYPTGLPATTTISGFCYPWKTNDPTYPFTGSGGIAAVTIAMQVGQVISLSYISGTVTYHNGAVPTDPDGTAASFSASRPGDTYISPTPAELCLIGGFADVSGNIIAPPFFVGTKAVIGPAPIGTTQLLLGLNDFPYSDNSGSWLMGVDGAVYYTTQYGSWERGPFTGKASFTPSSEILELRANIPESVLYPGTTTPLMQAINGGVLNGAKVYIQTLFWPSGGFPTDGISMGTMQLTQGQIGNIKNTGRSKIVCEVYDALYVLNRPFPPHNIQSACRHSLFDAGCTLLVSNFRSSVHILIGTGSTTLYLNLNIPARLNTNLYYPGDLILLSNIIFMCTIQGTSAGSPPAYNLPRGALTVDGGATFMSMNQAYPLGYIQFTSGQNIGVKCSVKIQSYNVFSGFTVLQLTKPLPFAVTTGDTVRVIPGCDKTMLTCGPAVFNNLIHFGGTPFVPNPEIAQLLIFTLGLSLVVLNLVKHFI